VAGAARGMSRGMAIVARGGSGGEGSGSVVLESTASTAGGGGSIYGNPKVYELAFGYRDFPAEVSFLQKLAEKHGTGHMRSLLELGAGPAWHSTAAAAAAARTYAVAVDNSAPMLQRARERVTEMGLTDVVAVVQGDITALDNAALRTAAATLHTAGKHSSGDEGFDVACLLLGTAAHLLETDDAISCLQGAAAALAPGGIMVLELEHPFDLFEGTLLDAHGDAWESEVDGVKVLVEWGRAGDPFDVTTHIVTRTVGFNVVDPTSGEPVEGWQAIEEQVRCRVFTAPEIDLLARLAGLRVVAGYGDMNFDTPLNDEQAHNMIIVLKKE